MTVLQEPRPVGVPNTPYANAQVGAWLAEQGASAVAQFDDGYGALFADGTDLAPIIDALAALTFPAEDPARVAREDAIVQLDSLRAVLQGVIAAPDIANGTLTTAQLSTIARATQANGKNAARALLHLLDALGIG